MNSTFSTGTYYRPSGKMPPLGIALFLIGGLAVATALAIGYVYLVRLIPFVYLNLIILAVFAGLLGGVLSLLVKRGKLRNPLGVAVLSLVVGLAAVYLQWVVFLTILIGESADTGFSWSTFLNVLTEPQGVFQTIKALNEEGTFTIRRSTPTGIILWLIWLAEAAVIVGLPYYLTGGQARTPFSEVTDQWAEEETLPQTVAHLDDVPAIQAALERGRMEDLTPYTLNEPTGQVGRLKLYTFAGDNTTQYLTLENITHKVDDKGKASQDEKTVVKHLAISRQAYQNLKERFGTLTAAPVATDLVSDENH